ncbi:MAG: biopolymer transporter ExbD [Myxococcota bacterium]
MNFTNKSQEEEITLELTPLIDMVFLLLIFFMVTTTFTTSAGIQVDLPRAKAREITHAQEDVVLAITKDGKLIYRGEVIALERLKEILTKIAARDPDTLIIVQADFDAQHGKVVEVMDVAKTLGLGKLAIATQE